MEIRRVGGGISSPSSNNRNSVIRKLIIIIIAEVCMPPLPPPSQGACGRHEVHISEPDQSTSGSKERRCVEME